MKRVASLGDTVILSAKVQYKWPATFITSPDAVLTA